MKKIIKLCLISSLLLYSDSVDEIFKKIDDDFKRIDTKIDNDFKIIQSKIDKDFGEALKYGWKSYTPTKVPSH